MSQVSYVTGILCHRQTHEEFVNNLPKGLEEAHECARKTLQASLKSSKKFYDIGYKIVEFKIGDAVYYLDRMRKNKLSPIWIGPCLIINRTSPYNFEILISNRIEKIVNHDSLKFCTDKILPKWIVERQKVIKNNLKVTYCICKKGDDGRVMIQCELCLDWFHHHCLNLSQSKARKLDNFVCGACK